MRSKIDLLIVDDNAADRELCFRFLRNDPLYEYSIREADSILDAEEQWRAESADIVLLDHLLVDGEGLDFMNFLHSRDDASCVAVVMLTGFGNTEIAVRAMKSGVYEYMDKARNSEKVLQRTLHAALARGKAGRALKAQHDELSSFAHTVAHDLRSPLATAHRFAQRLQRSAADRLDEKELTALDFILKGQRRMDETIIALLEFCQLGATEGNPSTINLEAMTKSILEDLASTIQDTGAIVQVDPLPEVYMDPRRMGQLMLNLLSNALKFRNDGEHRVRVFARKHGAHCTITIEDNGIGISDHHLDRIFKPFQRLHSTDDYPGNGIGLAICKKIVEQSNGSIRVESEPGAWTRFMITLPLPTTMSRGDRQNGADTLTSAPRVTPDQKHPVSVDFAGRNRLARGQLWDISTSGIAVNLTDTAERWEVGNQIELVIHFPGQLPFSAQGKVRHQTSRTLRDQVIGIEFLGLADALKDEVFGFVNTRL